MTSEDRTVLGFAPSGAVAQDHLEAVARCIGRFLALEALILPGIAPPATALDPARGQYHAGLFLDAVSTLHPDCLKLVAVTTCDLFLPIFTHVYGEARVPGRAAVVSLHRIRQARESTDSLEPPPVERTVKVALHEILHTFGLTHCRVLECLMRPIISLADLDGLPVRLCASCGHLWEQALKDLGVPSAR